VEEEWFRMVANGLIAQGDAPGWFATVAHRVWDYRNDRYKDLRAIPGAVLEKTAIVDDVEFVIHPEQRDNWIPIAPLETTALLTFKWVDLVGG